MERPAKCCVATELLCNVKNAMTVSSACVGRALLPSPDIPHLNRAPAGSRHVLLPVPGTAAERATNDGGYSATLSTTFTLILDLVTLPRSPVRRCGSASGGRLHGHVGRRRISNVSLQLASLHRVVRARSHGDTVAFDAAWKTVERRYLLSCWSSRRFVTKYQRRSAKCSSCIFGVLWTTARRCPHPTCPPRPRGYCSH